MIVHPKYTDYTIISEVRNFEYLRHISCISQTITVDYYNNGKEQTVLYRNNNQYHRLDAPAVIEYYKNGNKKREDWYINNKRHRLDGPGLILYNTKGQIIKSNFYIYGTHYTYDEFIQTPEHQAYLKQQSINIFD